MGKKELKSRMENLKMENNNEKNVENLNDTSVLQEFIERKFYC